MRCLFAALLFAALGVPAQATIILNDLESPQGANTVVEEDLGIGCDQKGFFTCIVKTFNTLDPIELEFTVEPNDGIGQLPLAELIVNNTGIPWSDFHWELIPGEGVEAAFGFFGIDPGDLILGPSADLSCLPGPLPGPCLSSDLTGIVLPDTGSFLIAFAFEAEGEGTFRFVQYPTVPEPATLALFGIGLAGAGFAARRRKATAA